MTRLLITGSVGTLGLRLLAHLADEEAAGRLRGMQVTGLDREPLDASVRVPSAYHHVVADLAVAELKPIVEGHDAVAHLAGDHDGSPALADRVGDAMESDAAGTRRLLDAASAAGVETVVIMSSAAVYGAWPDNAVPLTEDAPLRPNPGFAHARVKAEIERLAGEWRDAHPSARVCVLRPAPILGAPGSRSWLARVTRPGLGDRLAQNVSNRQYVHQDDVASAVAHALDRRLDGVFNVAPDRWIPGDAASALLGPNLPIPLPERASAWVTRLAGRGLAALPGASSAAGASGVRGPRHRDTPAVAGAGPYARSSWVVANDRLKATGWHPRSSSEEALVGSERPSPVRQFVARHRQEVTLGAAVAAGLIVAGVGGLIWRRHRHR